MLEKLSFGGHGSCAALSKCLRKDMQDTNASERELWETADSEGDDARSSGESESLSDIDDAEVNSYLNDEKEKHYKKIIWEKLNQKYFQEQQAKKAADAAPAAKPKKEQRQKRTTGVKKTQSAAEVAVPASSKRQSSRINYNALSKILDEPLPSNGSKRRRTESDSDQNAGKDSTVAPQSADDEPSATGEDEEDDGWEDPQDYSYYGNQEEEYNEYDDDDEF